MTRILQLPNILLQILPFFISITWLVLYFDIGFYLISSNSPSKSASHQSTMDFGSELKADAQLRIFNTFVNICFSSVFFKRSKDFTGIQKKCLAKRVTKYKLKRMLN